jgi:hypothetical protein
MYIILDIKLNCDHLEHHIAFVCAPARDAFFRNGDTRVCQSADHVQVRSTAFCANCFCTFIDKFRREACPKCRQRMNTGFSDLDMKLELQSLRRGGI